MNHCLPKSNFLQSGTAESSSFSSAKEFYLALIRGLEKIRIKMNYNFGCTVGSLLSIYTVVKNANYFT